MLKRIAAILFILPAIGIILAHSVIPHHYHDDRVCFNIQINANHTCKSEHHLSDDTCCNRHKDNNPNPDSPVSSESCLLIDNMVFHPGPQRHELECRTQEINCHKTLFILDLAISLHSGQPFKPYMLPFRHKPFTLLQLSDYKFSTPRLRAPPSR